MRQILEGAAGVLVSLTRLWPRELRRNAADGYAAVLGEVLAEAWRKGGLPGLVGRWLYEALDLMRVAIRTRQAGRQAAVLAAAAVALLLALEPPLPWSKLHAEELVVHAHDPAGEFTLTFRQGVAVFATVDGRPYGLLQGTDSVRVVDPAGRTLVAVAFEPPATIRWAPRHPASP